MANNPPPAPDALVVRDARGDERDAVRALTLDAYAEYATSMTPSAWAGLEGAVRAALDSRDQAHRMVAERSGALLGSVMLYPAAAAAYGEMAGRSRWPELRLLAVALTGRGLGVGRRLVDECIRRARADGAAAIGLHTSASMQVAMQLYRRMGFVRAPELDFQPEGAEVVEGFVLWLV